MKFLTLTAILIGCTVASAFVVPPFLQYKEGQRYFFTTDGNGELQFVDLKETEIDNRFEAEQDIVFRLYTRKNPTSANIIIYGDVDSLTNSNYDKEKATKIIAHGWNNNGGSEINTIITEKFLAALDVNVICVDWGVGAFVLYHTAVANVHKVGAFTGKLVNWLVDQGSSVGSFHIMGHSLGSHITGIAARSVIEGKIPYISAFDPALPLWGNESQRIRSSDADYVEIIHTNIGNLAIAEPIGHNDFYPNGGKHMPGCGTIDVACSHGKSFLYFAYSLDNQGFVSYQCRDLDEITSGSCSNLSKLHMGGSEPKDAIGLFYLETDADPPYYKG